MTDIRMELWNLLSDLSGQYPLKEEHSRRFHQLTNKLRAEGVLPPGLPYPFCSMPEKCQGKGSCQRDPCCAD
jgi:hypothetical protein